MYILILTLALKSGYAGMGGITAIEVDSLETCIQAGTAWQSRVAARIGRNIDIDEELIYTCVKVGG